MNFKTITSMYKKDLNDPDTHDGVITHLQPGILESEVKWALGASLRTKLVEVMESQLSYFFFFFFPAELFQVLKDDVVKVLYAIYQQT